MGESFSSMLIFTVIKLEACMGMNIELRGNLR